MMAQLKRAKQKKRCAKIDSYCRFASNPTASIVDDYDCMLNQTNIGHNNNKYYVIQMINAFGKYYVWNRWGRVGEPGQNTMHGPFDDSSTASKEFRKKFKDKTKNDWSARENFTPVPGKYTLIEMDDDNDDTVLLVSLRACMHSSIFTVHVNGRYVHLFACSICMSICLSVCHAVWWLLSPVNNLLYGSINCPVKEKYFRLALSCRVLMTQMLQRRSDHANWRSQLKVLLN